MHLRWYQAEAKAATYRYLETHETGNPCVVLPTGAGKTPLLAEICADVAGQWGGRVLVLAHVKELLEQAAKKLQVFLPHEMVGIYSAGLNSRDTDHSVIVAGIQSVYQKAGSLGAFNLIIVDETHLIPAHDGGMYRTFLKHALMVNPKARIVGLTATPYRLDCGYICGEDHILSEICYDIDVKTLISQGWLSPVKTRAGAVHADLTGVHTRGGEYIEGEMAERMELIVYAACEEAIDLCKDRHSILIFASSVKHANHIRDIIADATGEEVGLVTGDTPKDERSEILKRFKREESVFGPLRWVVNVNVLTTGFDAPNVDAIALMRATLSPGLYYQMVGRGLRLHDSKKECAVLDYGENAVRHGPIDAIKITDKNNSGDGEAPAKECPACAAVVFAGYAVCPECGFEFPPPEPKHQEKAGRAGIISGEITTEEIDIEEVSYFVHVKKGTEDDPEAPRSMRVEYRSSDLMATFRKEWVCPEHEGFARQKFEQWWRDRSRVPTPKTTAAAVQLAKAGALTKTNVITVREITGEKFPKIIGYDVDEYKPTIADVDCELIRLDRIAFEDEVEFGTEAEAVPAGHWFDEFGELPF